jgi:hypothetical protein
MTQIASHLVRLRIDRVLTAGRDAVHDRCAENADDHNNDHQLDQSHAANSLALAKLHDCPPKLTLRTARFEF